MQARLYCDVTANNSDTDWRTEPIVPTKANMTHKFHIPSVAGFVVKICMFGVALVIESLLERDSIYIT